MLFDYCYGPCFLTLVGAEAHSCLPFSGTLQIPTLNPHPIYRDRSANYGPPCPLNDRSPQITIDLTTQICRPLHIWQSQATQNTATTTMTSLRMIKFSCKIRHKIHFHYQAV